MRASSAESLPATLMALTPKGAMLEWAARPLISTCQRTGPLWESTTLIEVGSPTMTRRGRTKRRPSSAMSGRTPMQPTSSS